MPTISQVAMALLETRRQVDCLPDIDCTTWHVLDAADARVAVSLCKQAVLRDPSNLNKIKQLRRRSAPGPCAALHTYCASSCAAKVHTPRCRRSYGAGTFIRKSRMPLPLRLR
jgi:hypothetical protein